MECHLLEGLNLFYMVYIQNIDYRTTLHVSPCHNFKSTSYVNLENYSKAKINNDMTRTDTVPTTTGKKPR